MYPGISGKMVIVPLAWPYYVMSQPKAQLNTCLAKTICFFTSHLKYFESQLEATDTHWLFLELSHNKEDINS